MRFDAMNNFQKSLFALLTNDQDIKALIGDAVYDAKPITGALPELYLQIGDGTSRDISAQDFDAREWQFEVSIYAQRAAFAKLVPLANLVQKLVICGDFKIEALIGMRFARAQSYRLDQGELKRMTNRFIARFDLTSEEL